MSHTRGGGRDPNRPGGVRKMSAGDALYHSWRCENKRQFRTKKQAERTAKRLGKKFGIKLRSYYCPWCGKWHNTSHPWNKED